MAPRSNVGGFDTDYAKTPGPARYGAVTADLTQRKAPNYSLQGRNFMPSGENTKTNSSCSNVLSFRQMLQGNQDQVHTAQRKV